MKLNRIKKIFKVVIAVFFILTISLLIIAHVILKPVSDKNTLDKLSINNLQPKIINKTYKGFNYRIVNMQQRIDTSLTTLIFVHGSPGSFLDYKNYLTDSILNSEANIISYDRVGYGLENTGSVQGSIAFELAILNAVIGDIPKEKIVLIGYSYGGPIVLASPGNFKNKISLASAVNAELEPMFWGLKFYDWKITRWMLPKKVQAAAKEKYSHLTDLPSYEKAWNRSPSKIINIHGDKDWIVPYENSIFLNERIDSNKFHFITIKNGGHDLVWSHFDLIKSEILKTLR